MATKNLKKAHRRPVSEILYRYMKLQNELPVAKNQLQRVFLQFISCNFTRGETVLSKFSKSYGDMHTQFLEP
jgi:hypothetical protein